MGFVKEFKEFAVKGNVMDMAVGVIIGGAFGKIVTSMVEDLLMPLVGMLTGGVDFTSLSLTVGDANVKYGNLLQNVIDFVIVAFYSKRHPNQPQKPLPPPLPKKNSSPKSATS